MSGTCFVVMGFGTKTDLATGRSLYLDAAYRAVIKPAVEACGLQCVRADEIPHSGVIDVPMYRQLLAADLVIADLSTANANALYELGVRHALRPRTTIVIAEDRFTYPFDVNHIVIRSYRHLGEDIGVAEAERFRGVLTDAIKAFLADPDGQTTGPDSPVYTFLKDLQPPALREAAAADVGRLGDAVAAAAAAAPESTGGPAVAALVADGEAAIAESRFADAKVFFKAALQRCRSAGGLPKEGVLKPSDDPYLIHRLTLATYKAGEPNPLAALNEALQVLSAMDLEATNDPESLGLAGAIEKRLFQETQEFGHLDRAIRFYERGYYLKDDYYNGINLAFLLDLRAALHGGAAEKIADHVLAGRVRREVLMICDRKIAELRSKQAELAGQPGKATEAQAAGDELFWIFATQAEAYFGLGELERCGGFGGPAVGAEGQSECSARYEQAKAEASNWLRQDWMEKSFKSQIEKLGTLIEKNRALMARLQ